MQDRAAMAKWTIEPLSETGSMDRAPIEVTATTALAAGKKALKEELHTDHARGGHIRARAIRQTDAGDPPEIVYLYR
jgi:hypothetical protein